MRPTLRSARALRMPVLVAGLVFGLGIAALAAGARTAVAQRPAQLDFGPYLNRYGTRHVVHVPAGGPGASAAIEVTNAGWVPSNVAVVVVAAGGRADCGSPVPQPVSVQCLPAVAPKTSVRIDVPASGASNVFVYSIAPGPTAGCGALDDIAGGGTSLAAWEAALWKAAPGEPLAVGGVATSGADSLGLSAAATTGLGELFRGQPAGGAGGRRVTMLGQALPYAPTTGAQSTLANVDVSCARVNIRSAGNVSVPTCGPIGQSSIEVAPFVAVPISPQGGQQGHRAVWATAAEETVLGTSWRDGDGWAGYSAVGPREVDVQGGKLAFPLAMAGLTNERSVLWVSNLHPTATAQIDISMWDSNGNVLRFHGDAEGICPGGSKSYDLAAIAGEIPPLGGDAPPDRQGPKFLALRVDSKSASLPSAPPIAGAILLQGDEGIEAVPGLGLPLILSRVSGRQLQAGGAGGDRPRGEARSITVLSGVMNQYGPERRTTTIAVTLIGETRVENAAAADIYDAQGKLVIANVGVRASSTTGFLDLSKPMRQPGGGGMATPPAQPFRLPVGFIGTVVLRAPQGRGATFGAVAITRAMLPNGRPAPAPATGESFSVSVGSILPLFVDPTAPTRTPFPTTRPTVPTTPTAVDPTAEATAEATPTSRLSITERLYLPLLFNEP